VKRTRVLIVDDSLTTRKRLVAALATDPEMQVVGEAADGDTAINQCKLLRPDVITLDMMMPTTTGLTVTEHVMAFCPTPILIVSSSLQRGEALRTFDALSAGAVDVLEKPVADDDSDSWDRQFVAAVKLVARIKVITHLRRKLRPKPASPSPAADRAALAAEPTYTLLAIGASTGGPTAIVEVLRPLPASFPVPILLVLHLAPAFASAFIDWLGGQIAIPVSIAVDGAPLPRRGQAGLVMAPADQHLVIRGGRLRLTTAPERHSCRPSVDVLFESVAEQVGGGAIGCLLTGMGRDGAEGLLAMKRAGAMTLAQDEATSVVFGMPGEAISRDAVQRVLPVGEIGPMLSTLSLRDQR
jgi:two-component system, chemotaxis family, protein-glutamate methylesterase/glutaminase